MGDLPRILAPGVASGELITLAEPLSFWGGMDPTTGRLIDAHHPQTGASLAGKVVAMPAGRGSSSSSYVLVEAVRAGVAPAAILLGEPDGIVALAAFVSAELYGRELPVVVLDPETYAALPSGSLVEVSAGTDHRASISVLG